MGNIERPLARIRFWLPAAIGLAFLAVTSFGIITYQNTVAIRIGEGRVTNCDAIRETTHQLLSEVKDMETGQRGYLLTGDATYLEPFDAGRANIHRNFNLLRELTSQNVTRQDQLDRLERLVEKKQSDMRQTIEMRSKSSSSQIGDDVLEIVRSNVGKATMDELRRVVGLILQEEEKLLDENESHSKSLAAISLISVMTGNLIALGLISIIGILAYLDRKKRDFAERTLQAKQFELSAVIDSTHDGIVTFDDNLSIGLMNAAAANMHRLKAKDAFGKSLLEFVPFRMQEYVANDIRSFISSSEQYRTFQDGISVRRDGQEFPCQGTLTKTNSNGIRMNTLMFHDLTESKASQAKKRELAAILEHVRDAIVVCDMDDRILSWNEGARLLFGPTDVQAIGENVIELLFAGNRALWEKGRGTMLAVEVLSVELPRLLANGEEIIISHRRSLIRDELNKPSGQLILSIDVTDRKKEEAQERRSQRLESLGTLAGGVAHDLNNVLTPILMSAKLVKRGSDNKTRLLDTIIISAERGGRMIGKLLSFAGGERVVRESIDIRDIILEAQEILSHTLTKAIELRVTVPSIPLIVSADSTELSQVLMNLAINARDAMPNGGRLEIEVAEYLIDASRSRQIDNLHAGDYVMLTVTDNGEGIPQTIVDRIFDPFFTTKAQGKGTGLGLATALGIVRAYGGDISVLSHVGTGSRFSIFLPRSGNNGDFREKSAIQTELPFGRGETILVVDDESLIVENVRELLVTNGYKVVTAANGTEALEVFESRRDEIDLVLLDMMMPGIDGIETMTGLREIDSNILIIATSGLKRLEFEVGLPAGLNGFLAKPYSDEQLMRKIETVLVATSNPSIN